MADHSKAEKIYLTYKTRMLTEARLLKSARFQNGLMAWYSFWLITISLLQLAGYYDSTNASLVFVSASIGLFGLSLYITGQKHAERAEQFKSCYLQLKALYESNASEHTKLKRYAEILGVFENQTEDDFDEMVFDATSRGQKLYDSQGTVTLTSKTSSRVKRKKVVRALTALLLVVAPAILIGSISAFVPLSTPADASSTAPEPTFRTNGPG